MAKAWTNIALVDEDVTKQAAADSKGFDAVPS
jgi:hypothetical protein